PRVGALADGVARALARGAATVKLKALGLAMFALGAAAAGLPGLARDDRTADPPTRDGSPPAAPTRTDRAGDPLPDGALARRGSGAATSCAPPPSVRAPARSSRPAPTGRSASGTRPAARNSPGWSGTRGG